MTRISQPEYANVLNVRVDAVDMSRAVARVREMLAQREKSYICVAGVHGVMEARRYPGLAQAYVESSLTIPDGMPLVWVGHAQGHKDMQRVTGPDFMLEIFRRAEFRGLSHYLYGGDEGVVQQLRDVLTRRFPQARIVGIGSPPFRPLSQMERMHFIAEIRALKPDVIWMGISCPKQEIFMQEYLPLLDTRIMVGVGAAFDYHTGRIRDSAEWVKRAGLQWFHRLLQDPRRLWKRYLRNNPAFVAQILYQLLSERMRPAEVRPLRQLSHRSAEGTKLLKPEIGKDSTKTSAVA